MLIHFITLLAAASLAAQGPQTPGASAWSHSAYGDTVLRSFANAPYPHKSRVSGHTYQGKVYSAAEHYADSTVGIFIPAGYRPGNTVDFVVHFHGWNNHVTTVLDHYQLRQQFYDSGVNAILLVPQGPYDAPDSGGGKLENDPGAFKALISEIMDYLAAQKRITSHEIGRIVLSSHSGGYGVTAGVVDHGGLTDKVTDVLLFDSTYAGLDTFADWAAAGHNRRLVSIFTAHLAPENFMLITMLRKRHVTYDALMEPEMTAEELKLREAHLYHTADIEHDEIMQKKQFFALWISTCGLPLRQDRLTP